MKKLTVLLCLIMALLTASALAADAGTVTSLWPAYDPVTGLWGYIRADGLWGILPQYVWADDFVGDCAIVQMGEAWNSCGVIDENAAFVLAPEYGIQTNQAGISERLDIGPMFYVYGEDGRMGWFNVENRYFSGLCWEYCEAWGDPRFILVQDKNWQSSLARRDTGELLLPLQEMDVIGFQEGVAVAMTGADSLIIHPDGGVTGLPEGVEAADYCYQDGLLLVEDENGLRGYVDMAGRIAIEPQFGEADSFRSGYAVVTDSEGSWLIDTRGNRLAKDVYVVCGAWADGGVAVEVEDGWAVLNRDGTERFRVAMDEEQQGAVVLTCEPLAEGAPWWVLYVHGGVSTSYGLMTEAGEWVAEPGWTLFADRFSGDMRGWQATGYDGGFVDAWGNEVFAAKFLYTEHFQGELAFVCFDAATEGYINCLGEAVYQWPSR